MTRRGRSARTSKSVLRGPFICFLLISLSSMKAPSFPLMSKASEFLNREATDVKCACHLLLPPCVESALNHVMEQELVPLGEPSPEACVNEQPLQTLDQRWHKTGDASC